MGTPQKAAISAVVAAFNAHWSGTGASAGVAPMQLSREVVVEIIGATSISGSYRGWEQITSVLAATLRSRIRSLTFAISELIGNGDKIAAMISLGGETKDGRKINAAGDLCGALVEFQGSQISKIRLFIDTIEIETLLFGRRFAAAAGQGQDT